MLVSQLVNNYFSRAVEADESPLEPGVFLIPAGAIDAPPPEIPEGQLARWDDGDWVFELPPKPEPPTLEQAKAEKLSTLGQWLNQQTAVFEWEGATYQTDQVARDRLMASLQMHQLGVRPDPAPWRTLNNNMVDLSGEALTALCTAIYLHHQEVTLASFAFKDEIEALTTVEAVQGFEFEN